MTSMKSSEDALINAIRDVLSTICWRDENGMFYMVVDADYRDEISDHMLMEICDDDHPREKFWEVFDDWCADHEWVYTGAVVSQVLADSVVSDLIKNLDTSDARDLIRDQFYVKYSAEHYLGQDILIDLIVDTGDMNYEFTSNNIGGHYDASADSIPEESSLLWLARQQGYTKSALKKALASNGELPITSPLLKSIDRETLNCSTYMNALVFLVKMTLAEYFDIRDAFDKETSRNRSPYLSERTGRCRFRVHCASSVIPTAAERRTAY